MKQNDDPVLLRVAEAIEQLVVGPVVPHVLGPAVPGQQQARRQQLGRHQGRREIGRGVGGHRVAEDAKILRGRGFRRASQRESEREADD